VTGVLIFYLKRWKKIEILSWVGFASSFKNFGRAVACAVFKCACNRVAESYLSPL